MQIEPVLARRVRLVGLDVDGVMTDGGQFIGAVDNKRVEFRRFDIADVIGVKMLTSAGIEVVIVTGRVTESTSMRAAELGIDEVIEVSGAEKLPAFMELVSERGIRLEEVAYVGDDLPDIPILTRAGLPITVPNARPEVLRLAAQVTEARGGHGAVREIAEAILRARGDWDDLVQEYLMASGESVPRSSRANIRAPR